MAQHKCYKDTTLSDFLPSSHKSVMHIYIYFLISSMLLKQSASFSDGTKNPNSSPHPSKSLGLHKTSCGELPTQTRLSHIWALFFIKNRKSCSRFGLHDDPWLRNRVCDGFVWQHIGPVEVELIINDDVLPQHSHVLHSHPLTH